MIEVNEFLILLEELINQTPNDMELGKKVRKLYESISNSSSKKA
jgi:hypothetical protein